MTTSFINSVQGILDAASGDNSTATPPCEESINHYTYYQLCLIPAILITLAFAATKKRRNILLNVFNGRPGMIFPMDSLTRSSRISYACAFGATAYLVYRIVLEQTYAIDYSGLTAVQSLIAVASMFIYGMVFFPVFSSLALGSVFSFALGSAYVWMMTAVSIFRLCECEMTVKLRVLLWLRGLPSLLCLLFLCVSMPLRMVTAFRKGRYFHWDEDEAQENSLDDIRASHSGVHVTGLFAKPVVTPPPEGFKQRILSIMSGLFHRFVYQRQRGFRYPSRMVSVMFVAVIVIYTLTFEFLSVFPALIQLYADALIYYTDLTIGLEPSPNETSDITDLRDALFIGYWALDILRICMIVSNVLATVFSLLNVLHALSSYRQNLYALYRADYSHLPPASAYGNTTHCINSIKYAGFQVGYIIWSYLIQFGLLWLISVLLALAILMIINDFSFWIILLLEYLWPVVLTFVLVFISQLLLAKFVFLQNRGEYLALNNRNLYFNFTYFMFFYNIFLGLVSCILRILKAMAVGIVFLSRLDNSALPRRFEFMDPGFKAYVGYMHVEAAHTNPVVITFTRLMMLGLHRKNLKKERMRARQDKLNADKAGATQLNGACTDDNGMELKQRAKAAEPEGDVSIQVTTSTMEDFESDSEEERRRRVAARFNWHVTYTLLHNPDIRVMRKGYLQMLRQARLLGVHIPVSDRQADINFEKLQQDITDAKERYNPTAKKSGKNKAYVMIDNVGSDDDGGDKRAAEDVESAQGDVKKTSDVPLRKAGAADEQDVSSQVKGQNSSAQNQRESEISTRVVSPGNDPPDTPKVITSIKL